MIRIFDLDSQKITTLPGSAGMTDPRWSPDGRSIAANSFDLLTMNIFDFGTQRWLALPPKIRMSFPEWSKDSHFIYFMHGPDDPGCVSDARRGGRVREGCRSEELANRGTLGAGWDLIPQMRRCCSAIFPATIFTPSPWSRNRDVWREYFPAGGIFAYDEIRKD